MPEARIRGLDREYETIYVLNPNVDRESAEKISARVRDAVAKEGGKLTLLESWGRRRLAYPVQKHKRGVYVYLKYIGRGTIVHELERQLRLVDSVLKYQTVKIADGVFAEQYEVKEDQVQYQHVEPDEDEQDESMARILGLEEPRPEPTVSADDTGHADADTADAKSESDAESGDRGARVEPAASGDAKEDEEKEEEE